MAPTSAVERRRGVLSLNRKPKRTPLFPSHVGSALAGPSASLQATYSLTYSSIHAHAGCLSPARVKRQSGRHRFGRPAHGVYSAYSEGFTMARARSNRIPIDLPKKTSELIGNARDAYFKCTHDDCWLARFTVNLRVYGFYLAAHPLRSLEPWIFLGEWGISASNFPFGNSY